jgi:hypothetical protein
MRNLRFLLIFLCFSVFIVSLPVYGHKGSGSHQHPHPPEQHCMDCGKLAVPGQHARQSRGENLERDHRSCGFIRTNVSPNLS